MENIFYICITFILVTLINCLNIDVIIGRKQKKNTNHVPLKADKKNPGMMKNEIPKPPKYYPPSLMSKYFEYPPMSDEVKKAYDAAIDKHLNRKVDEPLLVITLKDNKSEPEIIYEGEPIDALDDLQFNYHTPAHSLEGKDLGLKIEFTSGRYRVKVNRSFQ